MASWDSTAPPPWLAQAGEWPPGFAMSGIWLHSKVLSPAGGLAARFLGLLLVFSAVLFVLVTSYSQKQNAGGWNPSALGGRNPAVAGLWSQ
jgi:hypothetical protein